MKHCKKYVVLVLLMAVGSAHAGFGDGFRKMGEGIKEVTLTTWQAIKSPFKKKNNDEQGQKKKIDGKKKHSKRKSKSEK